MAEPKQTRELFAVMDGDDLVMIVAKHTDKPVVTDITEELALLLRHKLSSPPDKS